MKKYQPQRLDKVLSKYLKHSRSDSKIENQYDKLRKYSKQSITVGEIEDQYEN